MRSLRLIGLVASVFVSSCASSGGSQSPVTGVTGPIAFACPAAGIATRTKFSGGATNDSTWQGSDPSDPVVCLVLSKGRVGRYLYGVREIPVLSGEAEARTALAAAFAGSSQNLCYEIKTSVGGAGVGYYYGQECWRQIGKTTIVQDGVSIPVVALFNSYDGVAGNGFAGDFTIYYDPARSIFIKADAVTRRGRGNDSWTRSLLKS